MKDVIVTDRPTQEILDRAHKERLMIFTFIHKPDSVTDYNTAKAFQEGWLIGLGLKPDHRLSLVFVPVDLDLKQFESYYLAHLEDTMSRYPFEFKALSGVMDSSYE